MYISNRRRAARRRGFSLRRLLILIIAPILIFVGVGVYQNRELFAPMVERAVGDLYAGGQSIIATSQAPTAQPTADPSNTVRQADQAWAIGSYGEATRLYGEVIEALPNDILPHVRYTQGLIMAGRYDDAVIAARDAVTANPYHPDAWTAQAMALNRAGDFRGSIASALHALDLVRLNAAAMGVEEDSEAGSDALREEVKAMRARARAYLAESYTDLGNFNRGFDEVNRALEDDPDNYDALFIRGFINRIYLYDFESAGVDLGAAYENSLEMPHIGLNLALYYLSDPTTAEQGVSILGEIVERNPENTPALYELGYYWRRFGGDITQAMTYLQRCVNADPENIDCLYELGRAHYTQESYDLAQGSFVQVVELGTQDPYHFFWAGFVPAGRGDCGRAIDYLQRGYALAQEAQVANPTNAAFTTLMGDFREALSGCGVLIGPPQPEATDEPSA